MVEGPFDDRRIFNTGNNLHAPATVSAGFHVDPEYALQTLRPGHGGTALRCCLERLATAVPSVVARRDLRAQTAVGREYPVRAREVHAWFWNALCQSSSSPSLTKRLSSSKPRPGYP